jgi:hypothetical protein
MELVSYYNGQEWMEALEALEALEEGRSFSARQACACRKATGEGPSKAAR